MNYYIIVLVIAIIVLLYILYRFFNNTGKALQANANLNTVNSTPISISDTSTRYAYGIWVYVNSWTNSNASKTIFHRNTSADPSSSTNKPSIHLYLDSNTPTLKLKISQNSTAAPTDITMTSNFPIQKWCYVCISVDGQYVDSYIDGKLVKSSLLNYPLTSINSTEKIYLGSSSTNDIYLAGFYHWINPLTPQEVWNNYLKGNGGNPISNLFASIGVGVTLFKNNVEQTNVRIL
jgi:hypothetical protein